VQRKFAPLTLILQHIGEYPEAYERQSVPKSRRVTVGWSLLAEMTRLGRKRGGKPMLFPVHSPIRRPAHVCWQGGATETLELQLPPNRAEAVRYPEAFVARIRELAISHRDDDIIRLLHAEGHQSSTGKSLHPKPKLRNVSTTMIQSGLVFKLGPMALPLVD
jgi:hypothetical protein